MECAFGLNLACIRGTVGRTGTFAQASLSRLGENSRSLLWFLLEHSLRRKAFILSDESSRLGEKVSRKRELVETYLLFTRIVTQARDFSFGRRAISPRREGPA